MQAQDLNAKLQLALSYVKTISNATAPINRIPIEILDYILSLTIDPLANFSPTLPRDPYYGTVQELEWPYRHFAKATRVCRYWRAITTQFASNWNTIQVYSKSRRLESDRFTSACMQYASLCLDRAAAADLDIAMYIKPSNAWWEKNLLKEMHRYRLLVIDDVDVLPQLCHPAPRLQSLTIEPTWRSGSRPPATIPQLFAGHAPSLRFLSIRYFVPWPANVFPGLTHLCLQGDGTSAPYNLAQCLEFLDSTPKLEELVIGFVETLTAHQTERIVSLPSLRRLVFYNCSPVVIEKTLSHLSLSSRTILSIRFQRHGGWRPDRDPDYFACLPTDATPRVLAPLSLNKFCMVQDDAHASYLRFVGASSTTGAAFDLSPGLVVGGLGRQVPTQNVVRLLANCPIEELWTSPARADASRLSAASRHPALDESVWRALFLATPRLRRLVLGDWRRYGADDGCLPALASTDLCPALSELYIIGDWQPKDICQLAHARAEGGQPLERAVIRRRTRSEIWGENDGGWKGGWGGKGAHGDYPWSKNDLDELQKHVAEIGLEEFEDFSTSLPDICFESRHAYWSSWRNANTL